MKIIPYYYGIVKSMIILTEYKKHFEASDELNSKLNQGLEYILQHQVYKKFI
ncbi:MAG: hypothetical protein ACFFG0_33240 [Candidatus Thorarchaeota archaeon]